MNFSLDKVRLKAISAIVADAGQVFLASAVIPFFTGIDKIGFPVLLSGLILTFGCWILSVAIVREGRR